MVGLPLREAASDWVDAMVSTRRRLPLALHNVCREERRPLLREVHHTVQRLFGTREEWRTIESHRFLHDWQTYGERALHNSTHQTLYLEDFADLPTEQRETLLALLTQSATFQQGEVLVVMVWPSQPTLQEADAFQALEGHLLSLPPLHQRGTDIDRLICQMTSRILLEHNLTSLEGFSLEAIAHIHRAVLQLQRDSDDLYDFLHEALTRAHSGRLPQHEGYLVAWPTVRLLEDLWQYRSLNHPSVYQELLQYNFQDRLFSASLEQAACRSGFSQELIELECQLLQRMIDELPEHQRNYQGLTARLDQLLWMSMKLISNARTQAELRDYFGFGGKGKIPKATAKLKFDQYDLEHYGFRSTDPQPWDNDALASPPRLPPEAPAAPPQPAPPAASPQSAPRDILEIDGELPETLFWRHQDLFTVLGADALTAPQIADLMNADRKQVQRDLQQLVSLGMLTCENKRYHLPSDDLYFLHTHSPLRFLEDNLLRSLNTAMEQPDDSLLDNLFLRLPAEGLPLLRNEVIRPFIHQDLLPLADQEPASPSSETYNKQMYSLLLVGTHRLSPQVHGRLPVKERIQYYFREASLQRADAQQRAQAICLQASLMLSPEQAPQALSQIHNLRKDLRQHLPQGRGNKPNFNITLCFTRVPLQFYRDLTNLPASEE